jgi:ribosome recycling factor
MYNRELLGGDMEPIKAASEERMKKTIAALHDEFNAIRTGRASPALLDKVRVDYYGQKTPLSQVATISVPEARLIVIQPWDRSLFSEIEKAILKSDLGLNPSNDGKVLRIAIPPLTEQRRKELVKTARNIAEQSRVAIRNIRRDGLEEIKKAAERRRCRRGRPQKRRARTSEADRRLYCPNRQDTRS